MKKYVVRPGDTMVKISEKTGVKLSLLIAANPQIQDPNHLPVGFVIGVPELGKPAKTAVKHAKAPAAEMWPSGQHYFGFVWPHVVKQGEDWSKISMQYGVSSDVIQQLNPTIAQTLQPGSTVYVPFVKSSVEAGKVAADGGAMGAPHAGQVTPAEATTMPIQDASEGPHTHHVNRQTAPQQPSSGWRGDLQKQERAWDVDANESSSWMSSWEAWDEAIKPTMDRRRSDSSTRSSHLARPNTPDGDGWSKTLSIDANKAASDD